MCNALLKLLICSSTQAPLALPCRKANDRHVSRQRDLFCCTWSLFAVVLAAASALGPRGANTSAVLQPREQQSDKQRRPNPGQVWGCVWYASPRYRINTRPVSRSACSGRPRGEWRAFQPCVTCLDGMSLIHICNLITFWAFHE